MKTLLIILLVIIIIIFIIVNNYSKNTIQGSGNIISENRELDNFNSIKLLSSIDVNVDFGDEYSCTVVGDDNLISFIKTDVINNHLHLAFLLLMFHWVLIIETHY